MTAGNGHAAPAPPGEGHSCEELCTARTCTCPPCRCADCLAQTARAIRHRGPVDDGPLTLF